MNDAEYDLPQLIIVLIYMSLVLSLSFLIASFVARIVDPFLPEEMVIGIIMLVIIIIIFLMTPMVLSWQLLQEGEISFSEYAEYFTIRSAIFFVSTLILSYLYRVL